LLLQGRRNTCAANLPAPREAADVSDRLFQHRREPGLGEFDSFPAVLRHLTDQVEDTRLRSQIRQFAAIFIAAPAPDGPELWKMAS